METTEYSSRRLNKDDSEKTLKFVKKTPTVSIPTDEELDMLLTKGLSIGIFKNKTALVGIIMTYKTVEHNVIAFLYISHELRGKAFWFNSFLQLKKYFDENLPIHLISKDISTFRKWVKPLGGDLYELDKRVLLWEE